MIWGAVSAEYWALPKRNGITKQNKMKEKKSKTIFSKFYLDVNNDGSEKAESWRNNKSV